MKQRDFQEGSRVKILWLTVPHLCNLWVSQFNLCFRTVNVPDAQTMITISCEEGIAREDVKFPHSRRENRGTDESRIGISRREVNVEDLNAVGHVSDEERKSERNLHTEAAVTPELRDWQDRCSLQNWPVLRNSVWQNRPVERPPHPNRERGAAGQKSW